MRDEKLLSVCKDWMSKQDKLELFRDYNDYLDDNQVRDFIWYVEDQIKQKRYMDPEDYLYEWFVNEQDWFNDYEFEQYYEAFRKPFMEEHPELADQEEEIDEILRDLMYDMDMYDSDVKHFDKDYNFYLLTDPCLTYELYDWSYPFIETKHKYIKYLQASQKWTANSTSMLELTRSGWYNGLWICIMLNISLFDMINIMRAKQLTVKKWTDIYLFNPYIWTGWDTTELTSDWTFRLNLDEIGFGVDWARHWPRGYTPDEVYWRYHPAFNKNRITFKSLKK